MLDAKVGGLWITAGKAWLEIYRETLGRRGRCGATNDEKRWVELESSQCKCSRSLDNHSHWRRRSGFKERSLFSVWSVVAVINSVIVFVTRLICLTDRRRGYVGRINQTRDYRGFFSSSGADKMANDRDRGATKSRRGNAKSESTVPVWKFGETPLLTCRCNSMAVCKQQ